jgi:tetratricopeptide (TPR) repeat protein
MKAYTRYIFCQLMVMVLMSTAIHSNAQVVSGSSTYTRQLYLQSQRFIKSKDFNQALDLLLEGISLEPYNSIYHRDAAVCFIGLGQRTKAHYFLDKAMEKEDADESVYLLACKSYIEANDLKNAKHTINKGIEKYPEAGMLYYQKGEMYYIFEQDADALKAYQMGITVEPNYSNNYYHAAKLEILLNENIIKAALYAETFLLLESFSPRSTEMKKLLYECYQNLYQQMIPSADNKVEVTQAYKASGTFEKIILKLFNNNKITLIGGINSSNITMFRIRFLLDWQSIVGNEFIVSLFKYQQALINEGHFEAYNQWLFGQQIDKVRYYNWVKQNSADNDQFIQYLSNNKLVLIKDEYNEQ